MYDSARLVGRETVTPGGRHAFATLDAMRGVAALGVVAMHFRQLPDPMWQGLYAFKSGYLAVDLFFVLSGFVLGFAYDERLRHGMALADFTAVRLIRLMPMIVFGAMVAVVAQLLSPEAGPGPLAIGTGLSIVVVPNPWSWNRYMFPLNVPQWSLFLELAINLAYAAAILLVSRRWLAALIGGGALAIVGCAITYKGVNGGVAWDTLHVGMARVIFSFAVGLALARTRHRWQPSCPSLPGWGVVAALALALMVPCPMRYRWLYDAGFVIVGSPALVILGSVASTGVRTGRVAALLATMSYPLYAIHMPIVELMKRVDTAGTIEGRWIAIAALLCLPPISVALARWYDEPVRRWLSALRRARVARGAPALDAPLPT